MLRISFIKELTSKVKALILFVKKKSGELRLCIDYYRLNKVIVPNRYLISFILEILNRLSLVKLFIKLDL
jgi:hypothetical protein